MLRIPIAWAPALIVTTLAVTLAGCGEKASTLDEINSTEVTLPNGAKLVCETMRQDIDVARGLMFRDPLPPGRGMLFVYPKDERHRHWTYQVRFAIDTVWLDSDHYVLEIVTDMPPCPSKAAHECPQYGGATQSRYAVEAPAGFVAKNGLKVGSKLEF